ncbi:hypothetical protein IFM89_008549 [Coptis chinensis]|uniref:Large ribosomal subunit protein uL29c n=1 Tax=Coptis chinensis TaxID=261450 RepID=A0A835I076_9MAGN|nr:hypothetical protein IFM89_008549 [Coptis chinensis]
MLSLSVPTATIFASSSKPLSITSVVMMAKREEELKEIRAKTSEEINEEIIDLKGELLMLRLVVAGMLTVRRERELEEGIKKRLSRKLDRQWKKSIVVRPPQSLRKMQAEKAAAAAAAAEAEKTA